VGVIPGICRSINGFDLMASTFALPYGSVRSPVHPPRVKSTSAATATARRALNLLPRGSIQLPEDQCPLSIVSSDLRVERSASRDVGPAPARTVGDDRVYPLLGSRNRSSLVTFESRNRVDKDGAHCRRRLTHLCSQQVVHFAEPIYLGRCVFAAVRDRRTSQEPGSASGRVWPLQHAQIALYAIAAGHTR
jgi:hypothetical protein